MIMSSGIRRLLHFHMWLPLQSLRDGASHQTDTVHFLGLTNSAYDVISAKSDLWLQRRPRHIRSYGSGENIK